MIRWLTVTLALGVVAAGLVVLAITMFSPGGTTSTNTATTGSHTDTRPPKVEPGAKGTGTVGAQTLSGSSMLGAVQTQYSDFVIINNCHVGVIHKQDVPAQHDGKLLYVAREIKSEEEAKKLQAEHPDLVIKIDEVFLYTDVKPGDEVAPQDITEVEFGKGTNKQAKQVRRLSFNDHLEGTKVEIGRKTKWMRRLKENDEVQEGQLLALVDPMLSIREFAIKKAKVEAAKADLEASIKTRDEAEQRYKTQIKLSNVKGTIATSEEDVRGAKLTWDRYIYETYSKQEAITVAEQELNQVLTTLTMHEVRSDISGTIKTMYKSRGEAVKNQDPVVQIQDLDRVRIEGRVPVQYMEELRKAQAQGRPIRVEASEPQSFHKILSGHTAEVKSVAVSKDRKIVSGSLDRTARVWIAQQGEIGTIIHTGQYIILPHPAAVNAVACTPEAYPGNFCLTGCADGVPRLWDLDHPDYSTLMFNDKHQGAINGVAFSPSGQWCATASEDRTVCVWNTTTRELVGRLRSSSQSGNGHVAGVLSVQFVSDRQLVSAGRDNTLIVWTLDDQGNATDTRKYDNRGGDVTTLGVYPAGKEMLFDQGSELRILSTENGRLIDVIQNQVPGLHFTDMALFSPDGNLVLSASGSENRLQLWRTPGKNSNSRAYELRQLIWPSSQSTSCGAFAPKSDFVVTGTRDRQVVVWDLPTKEQIDKSGDLEAEIRLVGPFLDTSSREVQVWAEINNKPVDGVRPLKPGQPATLVLYPPKKEQK
jgi:WD40 repeat protein